MFEKIISTENLFLAWQRFCRGKFRKKDVLTYEFYLERSLFKLQEALASGAWQHGLYQPFVVHDPKRRQIHKATVQDRIIHQAVVNILEPLIDPRFIYHSYSCRKNKGTHAAVRYLGDFLRQASKNNTQTVYALKCDIKKFFDSVVHSKLLQLLCRHVSDEKLIKLLGKIIDSFEFCPGKGLPLGNLTSQLFANVYLNELDRFVKFYLRERRYLRYCDDFVIIHPDRKYLLALIPKLQSFLKTELLLELHPSKIFIRSWTQGVDFLGHIVLPQAVVIKTKTKRRMLRQVNSQNLPSYLGICQHTDAYETQQLMKHLANISNY